MTMTDDNEWLALIAHSLPIAVYTASPDGDLLVPHVVNAELARWLGFAAEDFIQDPTLWHGGIHPADLPQVLSRAAAIGSSGAMAVKYRWRLADGTERFFLEHGILVQGASGKRRVLGLCLDVTDSRQAAKGGGNEPLTGDILHEINNLLTVILWNLEFLARTLGKGGGDLNRIYTALSTALGGSALLRELLAGHPQSDRRRVIALGEVLPRMARLLLMATGAGSTVTLTLAGDVVPVAADPVRLEQVLIDLAFYVLAAVSPGGRLTIKAANAKSGTGGVESETVALTMTGSGEGKSTVADHGIGDTLAAARAFAHDAGGNLELKNDGRQMEMRLTLPRADVARPVMAVAPGSSGARRTVRAVGGNLGLRQAR
jgi:signal transduction histidine kinase